jgi:hypothetical protein
MKIEILSGVMADRTVHKIIEMIEKYSGDIGELRLLPMQKFFELVKNQKYRIDPAGKEIVSRPLYTMIFGNKIGRDCKKQTVLIGSWAKQNGIPYKVSIVSTKPNRKFHHVFCSIWNGSGWVDCDATYKHSKIENKQYTNRKDFEV